MVAEESLLTVEDVNQRLPLVRVIVRDIMELHHDVAIRKERLAALRERHPASGGDDSVYEQEVQQMEVELSDDDDRLDGFELELQQIGGLLTNPVLGTVDFAGDMDGERIQYCWQSGEPEVLFWHVGECGETGRVSLYHELSSGGFSIENDLRQDA